MNADWKKIEAYAIFWTILKYHNLNRPKVDVVTGIVRNLESGKPINGAVISINDTSYVTDRYESLFYKYSTDPELLANGFYYLDDMVQDSVAIAVEAEGYYPQSRTISNVDTFFTYADFDLISSVPPFVKNSFPVKADSNVLKFDKITISFSRPMNTSTVEENFTILPDINGTLSWSEDSRILNFNTELDFNSEYTVTIGAVAEDNFQHNLDGNGDGVSGDDFVLIFKTGKDEEAPEVIAVYPTSNNEETELQPIISYQYNEVIDSFSLIGNPIDLISEESQEFFPGTFKSYVVNDKTVFNYFPDQKLDPLTIYKSKLQSGLSDVHGNETAAVKINYFKTGVKDFDVSGIDNFDGSFTSYWWQPSQSGSTTGIKEGTDRYGFPPNTSG